MQSEELNSRRLTDSDYETLRETFDGDEGIVCGGMGIIAPRINQTHRRKEENEKRSQFLYSDAGTRRFLLRLFPLLKTDPYDRDQARIWATVIYRYFRLGEADRSIEESLGWDSGTVSSTVQQIRRKIRGLRRNGKPYSKRPRGRPRKQPQPQAEATKINESTRRPSFEGEAVSLPDANLSNKSYPTEVPTEPNGTVGTPFLISSCTKSDAVEEKCSQHYQQKIDSARGLTREA